MGTREQYAPGTPNWVDLMTPDIDAARVFLTGLFDWDAEDQFDAEGNRIYVMLRQEGRDVAGLGGQPPGMEGAPSAWNSYVSVEDADATVRAAEEAGGTVVMPAMDVLSSGRMAILADPTGAVISIWQPGDHIGATLVNTPNAVTWNELLSRDLESAKPFYEKVFGWSFSPMGDDYEVFSLEKDGRPVGGVMPMPDSVPAQAPSHWNIYIAVEDVEETAARVDELGGQVVAGPMETPQGPVITFHHPAAGSLSAIDAIEYDD